MERVTEEKLSSVVASPYDPLGDELCRCHKSDDGEGLSECLSCDAEPEFERYCSANSTMGTPTVHGLLGTRLNEFSGSFKLGDESYYRVKNDVGLRKLTDFSEPGPSTRGSECTYGKGEPQRLLGVEKGLDLCGNADDSFMEGKFSGNMDNELQNTRGQSCDKVFVTTRSKEPAEYKNSELIEKEIESLRISGSLLEIKPMGFEEGSDVLRDVETMGWSLKMSSVETGGAEFSRCSDKSVTSSRFEHSDGDDSMFGGNTDDEKICHSYYLREVQCSNPENDENDYKLGMTSSIAFGSDDWDDFMQENEESTLTPWVLDEFQPRKGTESENQCSHTASAIIAEYSTVGLAMPKEEDVPSNHNQAGDQSVNYPATSDMEPSTLKNHGKLEHVEDEKSLEQFSVKLDKSRQMQLKEDPKIEEDELEAKHQGASVHEVIHIHDNIISEEVELKNTTSLLDRLSHVSVTKHHSPAEPSEDVKLELSIHQTSSTSSASVANDATKAETGINNSSSLTATTSKKLELNDLDDELVHDMEEILFDSGESPGFALGNKIYQSYIPVPSRDGGSTASTSGPDDAYPVIQHPLRFDRVEVIGARQKKGDVSLSERLIGVREYTVYKIRVWIAQDYWEVEKRYRDFCALYRQLKNLFPDHGRILPPAWSSIEQESRKIFGSASPDVIAERSFLIQECLNSLLHSPFPSGALNSLVRFLSPSKDLPDSPTYDTNIPQSPFSFRSTIRGDVSNLGKTISLIVNKKPYKSNKQLLEEQHYSCAGCYKTFNDGKTRIQELVQILGWGKPRLCEYSGQLYCSSCHSNDMAVLPARILHFWDFNQYPVSQLAKSYLDAIHDQPMLCVSAVNPSLFSKVPALQHVTNIRKRIGTMLPFVRCPFRRSIYKGIESRRYLLESNDFFSLRDLIDLSKGVFAALPVMIKTISQKILEHIAEQCLICCDAGIPCNARQACDDPSSLIFPFQEGEIERCKSCQSVFHKHCFRMLSSCPCGTQLKPEQEGDTSRSSQSNSSLGDLSLGSPGKTSDLSKGLFSRFFSKETSLKSIEGGEPAPADRSTVIVMGSLPMTNL